MRNSLGRMSLAAGQMTAIVRPDMNPAPPKRMSRQNTGIWHKRFILRDLQAFIRKLAAYGWEIGDGLLRTGKGGEKVR